MHFLPHITLFAASAIFWSETEALPRWFGPSRWSPANSDGTSKGCDKGTCVRTWKCPEDFVIFENSKTCASNEDPNWVCCNYPPDSDENNVKTNLFTTIKPIILTSVSNDEAQHEWKSARDFIYHDKSSENSNIKFPNDRTSSLNIRSDKTSEYADSDPTSWGKVTIPSKQLDRQEDYWDRDVIIDDESRESSDMKFRNHQIDYSDSTGDIRSDYAEFYPNFWEKSTKSPHDFERRADYWDKPTKKSTAVPTKSSQSKIFKDKWNPSLFPTQRTNFTEKLAPNYRETGLRKSTSSGANVRITKYRDSGESNKKTTPIPAMRTTAESYDNHLTNKMWNEDWKQSVTVHRKKTIENPQKINVTSSILNSKPITLRKITSATRQWRTTAPTKPPGSFWNRQTTSNPLHRKSTTISENNFSSKKWNDNWDKPSTSSAWKKTTGNEFQGGSFPSGTANRRNESLSSTTRRTTLTPTKGWNFSNRRTTTQQYTPKTKRPFIAIEPTYTNAWLWPESEENKNYGWESQSSKRSTSTQASSVRNFGNVRGATSSIRRSSTTQNRITTPMPDVNNRICGCRNRDEINMLNQRNTGSERRNTGPQNRYQQPFQRIVGGKEAEPFSWPWVAALYKVTSPGGGNRFLSAGTLVNKYYILTAAHVFNSDDLRTSSYVALLGTHNVTISISEYTVASILLHPRYEKRYYYNDIALLRLEHPVQFNDYVMPVCLPTRNSEFLKDSDLEGKRVTVMGWGDDEFGGRSSHVLREATFPIVSRKSCNASYVRVASNRFPRGITQEMLCAGSPKGGMDACQGDSGGPLLATENGRYTQVGIVSFGYKCGDKDFPGVYTKVSYYMGWIAENTQQLRT